jgi:hypothetical protein
MGNLFSDFKNNQNYPNNGYIYYNKLPINTNTIISGQVSPNDIKKHLKNHLKLAGDSSIIPNVIVGNNTVTEKDFIDGINTIRSQTTTPNGGSIKTTTNNIAPQ